MGKDKALWRIMENISERLDDLENDVKMLKQKVEELVDHESS